MKDALYITQVLDHPDMADGIYDLIGQIDQQPTLLADSTFYNQKGLPTISELLIVYG